MADTQPESRQPHAPPEAIAMAALLDEPVRRALFDYVAGQDQPVDRDDAATATGIGRPLAAFHLDRLVAGGLLEVDYRRRSGRTGPGAGRPAKFYRRATGTTVELSLPARRYRLAAEILAAGLEDVADEAVLDRVHQAARERGADLGASIRRAPAATATPSTRRRSRASARRELVDVLAAEGFEPRDVSGEIRLRNCPFDVLAREHRSVTCSMNLALLEGLSATVGDTGMEAVATPPEGSCCVRFVPA